MQSNPCPEFKVILVGEYGVGKSSLLRRFSQNTFQDTSGMDWHNYRESTIGLDNYCKKFECITDSGDTKTIGIRLYDTGGLERIGSIGTSYYKSSDAALLIFARNNLDSFNCLTQHLLEVLSSADNAKIFLVCNKEDLNHQREVSEQDIETFMQQFDKIEGFFKISCKTNKPPVEDIFCHVAKILANTATYRMQKRLNDVIKLGRSDKHDIIGGSSNYNDEDNGADYNRRNSFSCC